MEWEIMKKGILQRAGMEMQNTSTHPPTIARILYWGKRRKKEKLSNGVPRGKAYRDLVKQTEEK